MSNTEIVLPIATLTATYGYTADGEATLTIVWADPNSPGQVPDDIIRGGMLNKINQAEEIASMAAWEEDL